MDNRVSNSQIDELIEYLEQHPQLARGGIGLGGRSKETCGRNWDELAKLLNAHGSGATKDGARWRRYWADLKHRVKSRVAQLNKDVTGTGGGPAKGNELSAIDKRVLAIVGEAAVFGDTEHKVPFFGTVVSEPTHEPAEVIPDTFEPIASTSSAEPATVTESRTEMATPSGASSSFVRRLTKRRLPVSPTSSKLKQQKNVSNDWVMKLEQKRVEAETKMANAVMVMAEASRIQAEASRTMAEAALLQLNVSKEMAGCFLPPKLIEMLEK